MVNEETHDEREAHVVSTVDIIASRLKLYAATLLAVGALVGVATTGAIRWVTKDVQQEVAQTRAELRAFAANQQHKAAADSSRMERVLSIVELAVVALVEPDGSEEQRSAVAELRRRRFVTPRQTDGR